MREGDGVVETEGREGRREREWWGGDWASSLFVVLCPHVVLVVFVVWAGRHACVPCPRCRIVVVGIVGATSSVGCPFAFVVVGRVVVVVLCRGVGVAVWWGSWCVMVMWLWCGYMVAVCGSC